MSGTNGDWEYETLRPPRGPTKKEAIDPKAQLNELGGDGWELVTTVEYVGGGTKYMVFKRPASADRSEPEYGDADETDADDAARSDAATGEGDQ